MKKLASHVFAILTLLSSASYAADKDSKESISTGKIVIESEKSEFKDSIDSSLLSPSTYKDPKYSTSTDLGHSDLIKLTGLKFFPVLRDILNYYLERGALNELSLKQQSDLLLNAHSLINMAVEPVKAFQEALSETPGFLTDEPFYTINFLYKNCTKETASDCGTAMELYKSAKAKYPEEAYIVTQYIHTLRKHLNNYASLSKLPPKNMDLFLLNAAFAVTQGKTILTDVVKKAVEYRDILRDILQSQINNKEPTVLRVLMRSENLEDLLSQASFLILQGKATLNNALITAAGQRFMPALRNELNWCMHHNVNDFAKLTTLSEREKESLLLHASTLIVEDYYEVSDYEVSEALNKARGQKHVPELRKVLDYHIGKKVPRFTSLSPEKKEALLLNAGFLVVIGKATLDTDALIKALKL